MINCPFQIIVIANANVPPQGVPCQVLKHDQMQMDRVGEVRKKFYQSTCI
jgi:hypothetical protein